MYDYLDLRQTERLKELVPYKALAPDADEIIKELDRLNNIINELEKDLNEAYDELHRGELVNGRELINNIYQELKELKENK